MMSKKNHILVIDDELSMREFLQIFLERQHFRVSTAESAEEALMVFEEHDFDLVLSDLNLPGMDGFPLCASSRKRAPVQAWKPQ